MKKGVALILWLTGSVACWCQSERWTLAFWNVENFFDTKHDTLKEDFAFTPEGDHHWTKSRYEDKRDKIYKFLIKKDLSSFLKDLFEAIVMSNVDYYVIAVRNIYRESPDFEKVIQFVDTLYASNKLVLPLKGVLIIGY